MAKVQNNFVTLETAEFQTFITQDMIKRLCDLNFIPYLNDRGEILVDPADIMELIEEKVFGTLEKPKPKKKTKPAKVKELLQPAEEPPAEAT